MMYQQVYITPLRLTWTVLIKSLCRDIDGDIFEIYFGGLYSIYAFANIFLPFISGGFRDVMGDRFVVIMLGVLVVLG